VQVRFERDIQSTDDGNRQKQALPKQSLRRCKPDCQYRWSHYRREIKKYRVATMNYAPTLHSIAVALYSVRELIK
jgi:hypothetical protein